MALTNAERQKKWREDHKHERKQRIKKAELAVTELEELKSKSMLRDMMLEIVRERYEDEYYNLKREAEARLKS